MLSCNPIKHCRDMYLSFCSASAFRLEAAKEWYLGVSQLRPSAQIFSISMHKTINSPVRVFLPGLVGENKTVLVINLLMQTDCYVITHTPGSSVFLSCFPRKEHLPSRSNSLHFCLKIHYHSVSNQNTII